MAVTAAWEERDVISWFSHQSEVYPFVVQKCFVLLCVHGSLLKHLGFQNLKCKYIQSA